MAANKQSAPRSWPRIYAASLTPLREDLTIDSERMLAHCRRLLANGCDGLLLFGTTGEANSFSVQERIDLLDLLVEAGLPPERLLVGTGCCALPDSVRLTRHAVERQVGGALLLPPFYYKNVSDEGIFRAIEALIHGVDDARLRVYLYHIPPMAVVSYSKEIVSRLLQVFPQMMSGIKDSSGDWEHTKSLCEKFSGLRVFAGSERFLTRILQAGGAGCISATANVASRLAARVKAAFPSEEAVELQEKLNAIRSAFEQLPMVPALKFVMAERTGERSWLNVRPPLVTLSAEEGAALLARLAACELWPECG